MARPRVLIDRARMEALASDPGLVKVLSEGAAQVVEKAQASAPRSGLPDGGAESIGFELTINYIGRPEARVSWDKEHFYMWFHEHGTSKMPARPFLRPALEEVYGLEALRPHRTRDGRTIMATTAQIAHWTRGSAT